MTRSRMALPPRRFFIPIVVAVAIAFVTGIWVGNREASLCGDEMGGMGLVLGTWFLFLFGVLLGIAGLVAAAIGRSRHDSKTVWFGIGLLVAGGVLPATFFVLVRTIGVCG